MPTHPITFNELNMIQSVGIYVKWELRKLKFQVMNLALGSLPRIPQFMNSAAELLSFMRARSMRRDSLGIFSMTYR